MGGEGFFYIMLCFFFREEIFRGNRGIFFIFLERGSGGDSFFCVQCESAINKSI